MLSKLRSPAPEVEDGMSKRESMAESWASAVAGAEVEVASGSGLVFMPRPMGLDCEGSVEEGGGEGA